MDGRAEIIGAVRRAAEELGLGLRLWGDSLGEQERADLETLQSALTICGEDREADDDDH